MHASIRNWRGFDRCRNYRSKFRQACQKFLVSPKSIPPVLRICRPRLDWISLGCSDRRETRISSVFFGVFTDFIWTFSTDIAISKLILYHWVIARACTSKLVSSENVTNIDQGKTDCECSKNDCENIDKWHLYDFLLS